MQPTTLDKDLDRCNMPGRPESQQSVLGEKLVRRRKTRSDLIPEIRSIVLLGRSLVYAMGPIQIQHVQERELLNEQFR